MAFFVVTYAHPDEAGWRTHVMAHVAYLEDLLKDGTLRASGPFQGTPQRAAMLILSAPDRDAVLAVIAKDPFAIEGLIADMTVTQWDPMFGTWRTESSRGG